MRKPGRVGLAWIGAVALTVVLAGVGYWAGGVLGAVIAAVAGGFTPLLVERATRRGELVEAARQAAVADPGRGWAGLLDPRLGVVPFAGRVAELAVLEGWCLGEDAGLVRLMVGGGGAGKTRLALELMRRMGARGWWSVMVAEGAELGVVGAERLAAPGARLLLVVDYAEARGGLEGLLEAAARDEGRVRVLLLARQAGDWWERLQGGGAAVRGLVRDAAESVVELAGDLEPGAAGEEEVRRAVPFFAGRLGVPPPVPDLAALPGGAVVEVLDLHAAALVAVLSAGAGGGRVPVDAALGLEELLGHEKHYWRGRAQADGLLGGRDGLSMAQLSQVAAAGCLLGASTVAELGGRVPGVVVSEAVARWLRELYPAEQGGELGVLRPDRLAELHVSRELGGSPSLAEACLTGLDAGQARRALVLLARASGEHEAARLLLESSLGRFADVVEGMSAPREVLVAIADAIPYPSLALAGAHASISRQVLATCPAGTAERAQWLNSLAVLLGDLGRREDALAAINEAVTIRRTLAEARPDAFLPDLAMSLNNQSSCLSDLGRREDALAAINEAVTTYRTLAQARPDAFLPDLAMSLNNQSGRLSDLGRREDALAAINEAVTTYRTLAEARPDAFLPNLAMSLNNQSSCLSDLGRREDALAAINEAVTIRRTLAEALPVVFASRYANSLENQAMILSALGREADAQAARDEAAAIHGR